jgi:hypothetical protein
MAQDAGGGAEEVFGDDEMLGVPRVDFWMIWVWPTKDFDKGWG